MKQLFTILLIVILGASTAFFALQSHRADNGDINHDGKVNIQDVSIISANYDH